MTVVNMPLRGPARVKALKDALRPLDASKMSTPEIVEIAERVLPDCTGPEITQALRELAAQQHAEANALEAFKASR